MADRIHFAEADEDIAAGETVQLTADEVGRWRCRPLRAGWRTVDELRAQLDRLAQVMARTGEQRDRYRQALFDAQRLLAKGEDGEAKDAIDSALRG